MISVLTVQGIGWRGIGAQELPRIDTTGALVQRVWAQDHPVGAKGEFAYHRSDRFWNPPSHPIKYSLVRAWDSSRGFIARFMSLLSAPVLYAVFFTVEDRKSVV